MINMEKIRATRARRDFDRSEFPKLNSNRWRLVPVGYLVECIEERAAIIQHDGGLPRDCAESEAFAQGEQRFRVYELIAE